MAYTDIDDPTAYFQTKLYTGGTAEAKTFDGNSNLKPDWFWSKKRGAVQSHQTADSVRGIANSLRTDTTGAEYTNSETDDLASFDTNGFTFSGTGDTYNGTYQSSSYVAWCWSAGGGTTASNTDGSITSTVSANTTSGFSIVSYTGNGADNDTATIGHGLGVAPNMIMVKCRNNAGGWQTSSTSLGWNNVLQLNELNAQASGTYAFGQSGVTPTSTVFTVSATSGGNHTNTNNNTYIAYCFAEKKGFSKFGSYTGNESTNGNFVYLGFKPAFLIVKSTGTISDWWLADNKRNTFNAQKTLLRPNQSVAESQPYTEAFDFLSNGFKVRASASDVNRSSGIIYMAFAESPFVTSTGIPTTAR